MKDSVIKKMTETDIESLIKNSQFPNPDHKCKLREQLFGSAAELDFDVLARVAGGVTVPESDVWYTFPGEKEEKK